MRKAALISGLFVLFGLWAVLLPLADRSSFSVHMIAHMGVVAGAAPLIAIGLSGTRFDFSAGRRWLTPLTASLVELFAVWMWHIPVLRALSETSSFLAALEQIVFLAAGLALWFSCLGGTAAERGAAAGGDVRPALHLHAHDAARRTAGAFAASALR